MKKRRYVIQLEDNGAKLYLNKFDLAEVIDSLFDGNEDLAYIVSVVNMTDEEFEKLGEFEGF